MHPEEVVPFAVGVATVGEAAGDDGLVDDEEARAAVTPAAGAAATDVTGSTKLPRLDLP